MHSLVQDIRYALRVLGRYPGFSAMAILTLAIGIGANTTIFSAVYSVAFKPLSYDDPDRLVSLWVTLEPRGMTEVSVAPLNFIDWREQSESFETMAAARATVFTLRSDSGAEQIFGAGVSKDFFEMLGVAPVRGVPLDFEGTEPAALISHELWSHRLREDDSVIGRTMRLGDRAVTIVGVLPPSFHPPAAMSVADAEIWMPIGQIGEDLETRGDRFLSVAGRLRKGIPVSQAESELRTIAERLERAYPEDNEGWGVNVVPMQEQTVGEIRPRLVTLLGAVGLILLIACANVAHLVLARSESRRRELAVRRALGGSRLRLVQQILVENLVLAGLGCGVAIIVAFQGSRLLATFGPEEIPRRSEIGIDWIVLAFACGIALFSAVAIAMVPAIRSSGRQSGRALRESSRSIAGSGRRTTNVIVAGELALAMVLLIAAGLLITSLTHLSRVDPGFDPEGMLAVRVFVSDSYEEDAQIVAFFDRVREHLAAIPGVEAVAATNNLPFGRNNSVATFVIEGRPELTENDPVVSWNQISPGYFSAMRIPIRAGREMRETDDASSPRVIVISESMARAYWPGTNPIGRRMKFDTADSEWMMVIGMVPDVRHRLDREQGPTIYTSYRQRPRTGMFLTLRAAGDPAALAEAARQAIWAVDDDLPVRSIQTMEAARQESIGERRFYSWLLVAFAAIALFLAMIGVYGVTSFAASRRTTEVGIRMALGARRRNVIAMIVRQSIPALVAGITIGLAASLALNRFLSSLLFEIEPTDPRTIATAIVLLAIVMIAASLVPAIRAARTEPSASLRME